MHRAAVGRISRFYVGWLRSMIASAGPTEESFAEKLSRAAKERAAANPRGRKAAEDRAEKERARYRKPQRREPTKSE